MDDDEGSAQSPQELQKRLFKALGALDSDTRLAFEKFILWMSQRPKDAAPLSEQNMREMIEETRLENIRRRLGGKVGVVHLFQRSGSKE